MPDDARILLLADSHLGFDLPTRPRVERRRRGHDFLANYARALAPALAGEVDIVVHAGDVFDRSSVIAPLAWQAFEPLRRIAELGVPVLMVPGNHERSRLPHLRFASHPNIHVFDSPRTVAIDVRGIRIAFSGFPYERRNVRGRFTELLEATRWQEQASDARFLCVHHCVEGATVGPADYTFTTADDVIRTAGIPSDFAAVLSGHIHRHQVLARDLSGRALATPVIYPGSIERTAFAEIGETKGFMTLRVGGGDDHGRVQWQFHELPARPMARTELDATGMTPAMLASAVEQILASQPRDAVVLIRISGSLAPEHGRAISPARLRARYPAMNVEIVAAERWGPRDRRPAGGVQPGQVEDTRQLTLL